VKAPTRGRGIARDERLVSVEAAQAPPDRDLSDAHVPGASAGDTQASDSLVSARLRSLEEHPDRANRPVERRDGGWRVTGYAEARTVLMADTIQAGFQADLVLRMPSQMVPPVLVQHGEAHRQQRSQSARYFSPAVTNERHVPRMEHYAEEIVSGLERSGTAELSALASRMAISVAADVVGLTNSPRDGMAARLDGMLHADLAFSLSPRRLLGYARMQLRVLEFYLRDVRPAIRARRRQPAEDVISHLLSNGRRDTEILAECITYGAAGMVTTQEFICVVTWQCLRRPELAAVMRSDDREARYRLLHELLRLDPVVGRLYRRTTDDLTLAAGEADAVEADAGKADNSDVTVGPRELVELDVAAINADPSVAGDAPGRINLDRAIPRGIPRSVMGFGAGAHHCAGEFIALAETDVFVRRLLRAPGLAIEREPRIGRNENIKGYELRDFIVRCERSEP
jgi:cytochrome P450